MDLGPGSDTVAAVRPGDQVVVLVRTFGSTGRVWRLQTDQGDCTLAGHDISPGEFGAAGSERFTVGVGRPPCDLRLILEAPWSTRPDREFRITLIDGQQENGDV